MTASWKTKKLDTVRKADWFNSGKNYKISVLIKNQI